MTCNGGTQTCTRICNDGTWGEVGCEEEKKVKSQQCNQQKCPEWTIWSNWSDCSETCGEGSKTRNRSCKLGDDDKTGECPGEAVETESCNLTSCEKTYGLIISTNIPFDAALLDKSTPAFSAAAQAIEKKVKGFFNSVSYFVSVTVEKFIAVESDRKKRSATSSIAASVAITVQKSASENAEGSVSGVQNKLNAEISSGIADDTDTNSPLIGGAPSIDYCNELGAGNDCPADSTCLSASTSKLCSCNEGFRMISEFDIQKCKAACDLFSVSCSVLTGFTVTVKEDCRKEQYSHLTDFSGLFAQSKDLAAAGDGKPAGLAAACSFSLETGETEYSATFGFDTCGISKHTVEDDHTYFTTYVNHRVAIGSVVTSQLDQNELQCKLMNVDLETGSSLSENDEQLGSDDIDSKTLISDFKLKLVAGTREGSTFTKIPDGDNVDVGTKINVKLDFEDSTGNNYQFALSDCAAVSSDQTIDLYLNFCPNDASSIVGLNWIESTEYSLNIFRVNDATSVTFKCKASVYPENANLCNCDTNANCASGRRRRDLDASFAEVFATVKLNDSEDSGALPISLGAFGFCVVNLF